MNVCIVFNSKYSKLEASVSQTMSRDAQWGAKPLRIWWRNYKGKGGLATPSQVTQKV